MTAKLPSADNGVKRKLWRDYCVMSNRYTIDDVRAFCAAARTGQFNEAANTLYLSASALGRRIASIEEAVGGRVFDRSTRHVRLTPLGSTLYEQLSPLLSAMDGSFAQASRIAHGAGGHVVVATVATVAHSVLPDALEQFYAVHPGVFVSVRDGIASSIANLVEQRQAEFGIATHTAFGAALDAELIGSYGFDLVGSRDDPWLKGKTEVEWSQLQGRRVVGLNPTSSTRMQVDGELSGLGIALPWFMEVDQFSTMLSLIQNKHYCAVLPTLFDARRNGLASVALVSPSMRRQLFMVKRRDSELSTQGAALANLLRSNLPC